MIEHYIVDNLIDNRTEILNTYLNTNIFSKIPSSSSRYLYTKYYYFGK